MTVLNPWVVGRGGFRAPRPAHDPAGLTRAVASQTMHANGEDLEIRPAALAEDRLLIGAAEAAFAELLRDPSAVALR